MTSYHLEEKHSCGTYRHQVKLENGLRERERAFPKATLEDKGNIKEGILNKSYLIIVDKD